MPQRRRATSEFEQTQSEAGPRVLTLDSLIGGYNGYTSPDLLTPQFWAASSNVYAGQFGAIRRSRWAPLINAATQGFVTNGVRIASMFGFASPNVAPVLFFTYAGTTATTWQWTFGSFTQQILRNYFPPVTTNRSVTMWFGTPAFILKTDGAFREKMLITPTVIQIWGMDAPDVSPGITLNTGTTATITGAGAVRLNNIVTITATAPLPANFVVGAYVTIAGVTDTTFNSAAGTGFQILSVATPSFTYAQAGPPVTSGSGTATVQITKTVGRSYQYAWENVNAAHTSAPSPASQFVKYANQTGTIDLIQTGTVTGNGVANTYTGVGTNFTPAWIGRAIWVEGEGVTPAVRLITAVSNSTSLTINATAGVGAGKRFQVVDPQATNIKLYATGDGQPVYFLIGRNNFTFLNSTLITAGLEFTDTANSEPPNAPFTSEITQIYNLPPPIGKFLQEYQSRVIVYGVPANLQTFFYSNIEATVIGQPLESFSPLNSVTLPIGDGQLNGMANLPTGLMIWSNHQDMFKLTGLLTDNTIASATQLGATIQRLPYKIGAASPYATAVTPLGAIWLSSDREIWLFTDHYAPKNIGKPVQDLLNRITRLAFARMHFYKRGDRSWLALAIALDSSTINNKLLLLDLDLLASNGQPSFFTFDLATNAPTWYQQDTNCESITAAYDANSVNHLLAGDIDLVTDLDWQPAYFTIGAEQNVTGSVKLHAFGNEDPHMIKTFEWMRALTNQIPANLASQGWAWSIDAFDDDAFVIGVNAKTTNLIPGVASNANTLFLEYSPAKFRFGGFRPVKGRRFQIGTTFPSAPGLFELRGFEVAYSNLVGR